MAETTEKDNKYFVKWCKKWVKWWALNDWHIEYVHEAIIDRDAECRADYINRIARISFNVELEDEWHSKKYIRLMARHEVNELLLAGFRYVSYKRFDVTEDMIAEVNHSMLRRIENFIDNAVILK